MLWGILIPHLNTPEQKDMKKMDHGACQKRMKTLPMVSLQFILKDATEAAEAAESLGSPNAGYYRDEAHYAGMEITARQKAAS
jgi:hypothetical protein